MPRRSGSGSRYTCSRSAQRGEAPRGTSRRAWGAWIAAIALVGALFSAPACGTDSEQGHGPPLPGSGGSGSTGTSQGSSGPACHDGDTQSCHVTLGTHGGVVDCFVGNQTCSGGQWGACTDGSVESHRLPPSSKSNGGGSGDAPHAESLSMPGPCASDPCDPSCVNFDEQPDGGPIEADPSPGGVDWTSGDLGSYPPGLVNKGLTEPCHDAADCQFDEYCYAPDSGSCPHDICDPGVPLGGACDASSNSCVSRLCADPATQHCCAYDPTGQCPHDPCTTGAVQPYGCDTCVGQICGDPGGETCAANGDCASGACQNVHGTCSNGGANCTASPCGAPTGTCNQQGTCSTNGAACTGNGTACNQGQCGGKVCSQGGASCSNLGANCRGTCRQNHLCSSDGSGCSNVGGNCGPTGSCVRRCSSDNSICPSGSGYKATCGGGTCQNVHGTCSTDGSSCNSSPCGPPTGTCNNVHGTCSAVAGSRSSCCSSTWDATCVNLYTACKGQCQARTWDASCIQGVHDKCGAFCSTNSPNCTHDECDTGASLTTGCSTCVTTVCNTDPACCQAGSARQWDSQCVSEVSSLCGFECPAKGQCTPWSPRQTDPQCPGIDLTVGVPCDGTIPVCNRGNTTAPAGVTLVHFPANSQQYPLCNPDLTFPQMVTCTTSQPILPGTCIDVTNCPGLNGNREIMVNPAGPGHVAECNDRCDDNWSLFSGGSCSVPACSGLATHATLKKVDMFVTVDKSGSMDDPARWSPAMTALKAFFQDPQSAGLGVALRFWPDSTPSCCDGTNTCSNGQKCSFSNCSQPAVALGTLTAQAAPTDTQEQALINSINAHSPNGDTPMYAALGGAEQWATNYAAGNPNDKVVVVMITDGEPTACDTNVNDIAALAANAYTANAVQTYVIGIAGVSQSTINKIATAGHGQAFFIASGQNTQAQLLAAMNAIRGQPVTCNFPLPPPGSYDPSNVKVTYTSGSGSMTTLMQQPTQASCGGGWYFDNNANPSQIILCPTTCNTVKGDSGASIDAVLGCPTPYQQTVYKQQYVGSCGQGQTVQWGYMSYQTVTPSDSSISMQAQTGSSATTYGALHTLATAQASPNTQDCPMSGPSPCPLDLYSKIGLPDDDKAYLQLVFTLNPSSDRLSAPELKNWDVTYTCVDSE